MGSKNLKALAVRGTQGVPSRLGPLLRAPAGPPSRRGWHRPEGARCNQQPNRDRGLKQKMADARRQRGMKYAVKVDLQVEAHKRQLRHRGHHDHVQETRERDFELGVGQEADPFAGQLLAVCGNGTLEAGEPCDDGNLLSGDGPACGGPLARHPKVAKITFKAAEELHKVKDEAEAVSYLKAIKDKQDKNQASVSTWSKGKLESAKNSNKSAYLGQQLEAALGNETAAAGLYDMEQELLRIERAKAYDPDRFWKFIDELCAEAAAVAPPAESTE